MMTDPPPESKATPSGTLRFALFTALCGLCILPFMLVIQPRTDEGIFLVGARRIQAGQVFARDFFELMGPGSFYWLSAFYRCFGATFFASRVCLFVASLATCILLYAITRTLCRGYWALPCILVMATYYGGVWPGISHHTDSNVLALLCFGSCLLWIGKRRSPLLFCAGAFAGVAALIQLPKGMMLLAAITLTLCVQEKSPAQILRGALQPLAGFVAVLGAAAIYFWNQGALAALVNNNLLWPMQHYASVNVVPYALGLAQDHWSVWMQAAGGAWWMLLPASILIVPYLFIATLPAVLSCLAVLNRKAFAQPQIAALGLFGTAMWISEMQRKDLAHLVFGSPLLVILCVHLLQQSQGRPCRFALQTLAFCGGSLVAFNLLLVASAHPVSTRMGTVRILGHDPVPAMIDLYAARREDLFIYPYAPSYYFLSDTTNPTPYSVLYNGSTTEQVEDAIHILDQKHVRRILWDTNFENEVIPANFPNAARMTPGTRRFENYLTSHYRVIAEAGGFRMMERLSQANEN